MSIAVFSRLSKLHKGVRAMRSVIIPLVRAAASLGLFAVTPSQAEAQVFWRRRPAYSYYYNPGYTYSYSYGYPTYSYYSGPTYSPGYYSYYSPGYTSSYWQPGYRSYYR